MTKVRPVQGSLMPEITPDRPVGRILPSVFTGTNADLMVAVAPFYFTGDVMDCTYGEGSWWSRFRPPSFVAHDLYKLDGVDFTALPEPDETYDTVVFDPPYIPQGGDASTTSTTPDFVGRFGLVSRSRAELDAMNRAGVGECARVVRSGGFVVVKCMDYVNGGAFRLGHRVMIEAGEAVGLRVHDLIVHHTGSGPGGHNIFDPIRARRNHSYLLVMVRP
jgi:hypothetical protein